MKYNFLILMILFCGAGCITAPKDYKENTDRIPSIELYQQKAEIYEQNDELQLALANLRIAEKLLIDKINLITDHISNKSEMHFQSGLTLYNSGSYKQAKKEFLKALRYDRNHQGALDYLKNRHKYAKTIVYTVEKGDTCSGIAGKVYKNRNYDYIVKSFSLLPEKDTMVPGRIILLPVIEPELTKLFFNYRKEILHSRKLYREKRYKGLLIASENILRLYPEDKEARFMLNTACYKLGNTYYREGRYEKAIAFYKRVEKPFRDVKKEIEKVHLAANNLKNIAIENKNYKHYYIGLEFYKSKEYQLALNSLKKVEKGYKSVNEIISKVRSQMKMLAEHHYKNGVKHFVNEDLEKAIKEWKTALDLNPERKMIKRDIENAMNLLEKIKKID